jgi:hypothetical protein
MLGAEPAMSAAAVFDPVVALERLGPLGPPINTSDGESEGIFPLLDHPGWLIKVYRAHLVTRSDTARLDWLISLPGLVSASDRERLKRHASWPAARVTSWPQDTYGVIIPRAPERYRATLRVDAARTIEIPLEIDWLASDAGKCRRRGIATPGFIDRLVIRRDIVAVAEFLERYEIVYGDWSYANAFWSEEYRSGYVIDLDGSGYRSRTGVGTLNWGDDLPGPGGVDTFTDRYGVAVMLARCLTGVRDIESALRRLRRTTSADGTGYLYDLVYAGVRAGRRQDRPTIKYLYAAVRKASARWPRPRPEPSISSNGSRRDGSGVVGWRPAPSVRSGELWPSPPTGDTQPDGSSARRDTVTAPGDWPVSQPAGKDRARAAHWISLADTPILIMIIFLWVVIPILILIIG